MAIVSLIAGVGSAPPSESSGGLAPNVTATATPQYHLYGNQSVFGFQGTINLPTSDPNYSHLNTISVVAYTGSVDQGIEICNFSGPFTETTLDYDAGDIPQTAEEQTWGVEFVCTDENGVPTVNPFAVENITVNPSLVTAVTASDNPAARTPDPVNRLVSTEIDWTATFSNDQYNQIATFWISPDNGTSWIGIGWTLIEAADQVNKLSRLVPLDDETWKMAVCAGALENTYAPIPTSDLPDGCAFSPGFHVAGLGMPRATNITELYVSPGDGTDFPFNAVTEDGTQYWLIPEISYDDTGALDDANTFFVRITAQDLGASHEAIGPEQPYSGTGVVETGQTHKDGLMGGYGGEGYLYDRSGNIAYVRLKVYCCNRYDQTSYSFQDTTHTARLQTGIGGGAGYVDVLVANGGAIPEGAIPAHRLDPTSLSSSLMITDEKKLDLNYTEIDIDNFSGTLDASKLTNLESINVGSFSGALDASHVTNLGSININAFTGDLDASHVTNLGAINIGSLTGDLDASKVSNLSAINIASLSGTLDASKVSNLSSINVNAFGGNLDASKISNLDAINIGSLSGTLDASKVANLGAIPITTFTGNLDASHVSNLGSIPISTFTGTLDASKVADLGTIPISTFSGTLDASKVSNLGSIAISTFGGNLDASHVTNLTSLNISSFGGNLDASRVANLGSISISTFGGNLDVSQVSNLSSVNVGLFSGVLVSSQIADGIIDAATKIGAGVFGYGVVNDGSTIRLGTTDTSNMVSNPDFEYGTKDWGVSGSVTVSTAVKYTGTKSLQIVNGAQSVNNLTWISCKPGDQFILSSYVMAAAGATGNVRNLIRFFDINNVSVGDGPWGSASAATATNTWTNMQTGISTAPPNATGIQIYAIWSEVATGTWYLDNVVLRRAVDQSMISSVNLTTTTFNGILAAGYVKINAGDINGTITAGQLSGGITADKITSINISALPDGGITGGKIAAYTITGTNIGVGTVTGANIASYSVTGGNIAYSTITAYNIASQTITGSQIANLTITGNQITNLTITGGKIAAATITDANIGNCSIGKLTAGTIYVQSTTSGIIMQYQYGNQRTYIYPSSISMYTSTGNTAINLGGGTGAWDSVSGYLDINNGYQAGFSPVVLDGSTRNSPTGGTYTGYVGNYGRFDFMGGNVWPTGFSTGGPTAWGTSPATFVKVMAYGAEYCIPVYNY